jgi:uncharacterized protein YoxC
MIAWNPRIGPWLVQQAATFPDTLLVKQVSEPRSWFDTVSGVASIFISIALLALCVGLIPAAWNFRKSYKKVNDLLDKVYGDINPIMRHASTIADNVNYVTTSIRVDVRQVNETIATANLRLQEAVRLAEQRLHEFNALMDVVQQEAEGVFVSTAATVRGVRHGAATLRDEVERGAVGGGIEGDEFDDEYYDETEPEELTDGEFTDGPDGGERPRVRPRGGTRGPA